MSDDTGGRVERAVTVETWVGQFFGAMIEVLRLNLAAETDVRAYLRKLAVEQAEREGEVASVGARALGLVQVLGPTVERMERLVDIARTLLRTFGSTMPPERALDTALTLSCVSLLATNRKMTHDFYLSMLDFPPERLATMAENDAWAAPATLVPVDFDLEAMREGFEREAIGQRAEASADPRSLS